jgi:hypothetical protein
MMSSCRYLSVLGSLLISQVFAQNQTCVPPKSYNPSKENSFPQPFVPYFAPNGTQSFDDSDQSGVIKYTGTMWKAENDTMAFNSTLHSTNDTMASVSFTFRGTGIEWFGTTGKDHGIANVREPKMESNYD